MDIRIQVDKESLVRLGNLFKFAIHGSTKHSSGAIEWDLEFPDMIKAASFAQTMISSKYEIDIRFQDSVTSLSDPVVLTLVVEP